MLLSECEDGVKAIIKSINADDKTKRRLLSMGLFDGAEIEMVKCSQGASLVLAEGRLFALGRSLCDEVTVNETSTCR